MPTTAFSLTFFRLLADRGRSTAWTLFCAMLVLAAWCWWATRAQVTLYEISTAAPVELDAATHPIQSPALDPENLEQCLECVMRRAPTLLVIAHP